MLFPNSDRYIARHSASRPNASTRYAMHRSIATRAATRPNAGICIAILRYVDCRTSSRSDTSIQVPIHQRRREGVSQSLTLHPKASATYLRLTFSALFELEITNINALSAQQPKAREKRCITHRSLHTTSSAFHPTVTKEIINNARNESQNREPKFNPMQCNAMQCNAIVQPNAR